ncbi:MAG TPA: MBL fold metallo-hydrolase [Candidatus Sulfotelmatobacter sp.]
MPTETTPPKADEFEISIFGPGRGECVLIHLGQNEWCVVDSCVSRGRTDPVAVEYLRSFNNDALANVRLVVATHWHDDHIRGMASLLSRAPHADFCCSAALEKREFLTLISAASATIPGYSGVDEFAAIINQLEVRGRKAPKLAVENKLLLTLSASGRAFPITLESLSPSDPTIQLALAQIKSLLPQVGTPQRRIVNRTPNHTSVVIWVEAGPVHALLGADLEHTSRADQGWTAVLACHCSRHPAHLFKVPHHGSPTADNAVVWERMLAKDPVAVVTSFAGGSVRLPEESDLKRLSSQTASLYCTARFGPGKPPNRDPLVEKEMRRQLSERRVLAGQPGHVRVRWSATESNPAALIETFNGAYHVNPR